MVKKIIGLILLVLVVLWIPVGLRTSLEGVVTPAVGQQEIMGEDVANTSIAMFKIATGVMIIFIATWPLSALTSFSGLMKEESELNSWWKISLKNIAAFFVVYGGFLIQLVWIGFLPDQRIYICGAAVLGGMVFVLLSGKKGLDPILNMMQLSSGVLMVSIMISGTISVYTGKFMTLPDIVRSLVELI